MATSRQTLRGTRGWLTVAALTLTLATILGTQAVSAAAGDTLTPTSAPSAPSPSVISPTVSPLTAPVAGPSIGTATGPADAAQASAVPAPKASAAAAPATPVKRVAPARPRATDVCAGPAWSARRGQLALSTLKDSGQRSGVTVTFKGARSGYLGMTYPARRLVEVYVRSCSAESMTLLRHVMSHEMGHAYDAAYMTAASRKAYMAMRGIPAGTPWFGCNYCSDFATPAGDFAEAYSQWQRDSRDSRTRMASMPTSDELATIAATFFGA